MSKNRKLKCKFRDKKYNIKFIKKLSMTNSDGLCDDPKSRKKTIEISNELSGKKELEIVLHESLHACFWDLDEEAITETAIDISKFLWKCGYRKINKKNDK
jgi:hypothetical protein